MDIRTELEHENLIAIGRESVTDELIQNLSADHHVLLVCDASESPDEETRRSYIQALADADIIAKEQVEPVLAETDMVIIVPVHTLEIAERLYRSIDHASHFVRIFLDGRPYATC